MIYTPPPNFGTPQQPAQIERAADVSVLQNNHASNIIKELVLGYYVSQSIKANDAQQIVSGVQIVDLQTNRNIVEYNTSAQHFAASVNKLPVALLILEELRAGRVQLDQIVSWEASDVRAGAGVFDQAGAPMQASVQDVMHDMLNRSGNTAVRIFVNRMLGGAAAVNNRWAQIPQLSNTRLQPLDANRFYVGNSTPSDAMWVMKQLLAKQDLYGKFLKKTLSTNIYTDMGARSQLAGNDYIILANKVGILDDPEGNNRHDVGIIYNLRTHKSYGYSLFTTSPYESATATTRADQSLKEMGGYTLRFSGDRLVRHYDAGPETLQTRQSIPVERRVLY